MVSSERAPIRTAEDFRGKLIGVPSEGGTSEITLDLIIESAGIPREEVPRQVVGLAPGVFELVQAGRIGAYTVSLDTSILLEQSRPDAVVYNPNDAIDAGDQVYVTSRQQAQDPEKQDQLRRYLLAIRDAMQFMIDDEANGFAETMRIISESYDVPALENPEVAREALAGYVDAWTGGDALLHTSPEAWTAIYEEVEAAGEVPEGLNPADWMTNDFAPEASS
jgi:NitT/TauT family transport system substrate-binding protein